MKKKLRVAIVHDYLVAFGGAERVLVALHEIWPEAPVYLSIADKKFLNKNKDIFASWDLKASWFQKIPFATKLISPLRFLLPLIWRSFNFDNYDLVISSSSWAMTKAIKTSSRTTHICYCHTPPRFLYGYPQARYWTKYWPVKIYSAIVNHFLRLIDFESAKGVDHFIANSEEVARRIKKFYKRESTVIQPPVVPLKKKTEGKSEFKDFYLYASRLFSYKHPELAIKACQKLGKNLIISGDGALKEEVENLANRSKTTIYLGRADDEKLAQLYTNCKAFIYPVESEDFGVMSLEAASFGKPTIGLFSGGVKETILDGKTGTFFDKPTVESLMQAITKFEKMKFSPKTCKAWADKFSQENFKKRIRKFVSEKIKAPSI